MQVIDALRRHDCSEALAWCAEQRPRLKKAKSKLEFELRVQVCCGDLDVSLIKTILRNKSEQRPRLKKAKSKLEFELRVQVCCGDLGVQFI